jgi:hypothetical protein
MGLMQLPTWSSLGVALELSLAVSDANPSEVLA